MSPFSCASRVITAAQVSYVLGRRKEKMDILQIKSIECWAEFIYTVAAQERLCSPLCLFILRRLIYIKQEKNGMRENLTEDELLSNGTKDVHRRS